MGLVLTGYDATYTLIDSGGNTTVKIVHLTTIVPADAVTDEALVRAALLALTDGVITKYSLAAVYDENAVALPATAEIETKLSMTLRLANKGDQKSNMAIPAPKIGLFQGTTGPAKNVVNYSNAALSTWLDLFRETTGKASFSDGDFVQGAAAGTPINGLVKGIRTTVASRQG